MLIVLGLCFQGMSYFALYLKDLNESRKKKPQKKQTNQKNHNPKKNQKTKQTTTNIYYRFCSVIYSFLKSHFTIFEDFQRRTTIFWNFNTTNDRRLYTSLNTGINTFNSKPFA